MDESDQTLSPARYDDEIDLRELARVIWAGKWLIAGIAIAASIVAVVIALMLPNVYRAEALLGTQRPATVPAVCLRWRRSTAAWPALAGINLGYDGTADETVAWPRDSDFQKVHLRVCRPPWDS